MGGTATFCRQCGSPSTLRVPEGDNRARPTCDSCGTVAYDNPKIIVAVVLHEKQHVLWMRRATPPYAGRWTLPAGFVECGETVPEAASREVLEETALRVDPTVWRFYSVLSLPDLNEVYLALSAALPSHDYAPTTEATELRLFSRAQIADLELGYPDPTYPLVMEAYGALERDDLHRTPGHLWEIRGRDPGAGVW